MTMLFYVAYGILATCCFSVCAWGAWCNVRTWPRYYPRYNGDEGLTVGWIILHVFISVTPVLNVAFIVVIIADNWKHISKKNPFDFLNKVVIKFPER
jgi:hypothetical protein